eukprot:UN06454
MAQFKLQIADMSDPNDIVKLANQFSDEKLLTGL